MIIKTIEPSAAFDIHFSNPSNKRILFSGKFGSGKTYFLKEYFEAKKDQLNTFWLSPVKYSVGLNEDIFEYIKFDLALKLIGMPEFAPSLKSRFGEDLYMYQFLSNQPQAAIDTLLLLIETMAKGTIDGESIEAKGLSIVAGAKSVAIGLMDYYQKYKNFKNSIDKASETHSDLFKRYLEDSVLKKGSIFENDLITQTIKSAIEICKQQGKKENVLIIDDFDRLDPEHVFRILNILSVHNDMFDEDNKFGFDKIIIVCDYDNIAKIYAYKYGSETSFSGYISKFFSTEVFHFNNKLAIQQFCRLDLGGVIPDKDSQDVLGMLLAYFVEKNILTMREIIKVKIPTNLTSYQYGPYNILENFPTVYKDSRPHFRDNKYFIGEGVKTFFVTSEDYPFIHAIRVLCLIFGDYDLLKNRIEKIDHSKDTGYDKEYVPKLIKTLMLLLHHASNQSELSRLCFTIESDNHRYVVLSRPSTVFLQKKFFIETGWSDGNQYTGDVSYYKNVNKFLNLKDDIDITGTAYGNFKSLFNELTIILNFLDGSGTLQHFGVTKSSI
ncbi:hypothetical protein G8759_25300 [Spirosoma aureum]|uniref:KAP NTPase domain-containing protein n=1 Tax=Spirosoma aureum TaxID=2692134 RepID=A0A6G9AU23_9BACT|nr:P-loop NTPase fold protein [Spirosoma aureum]QIP15713.1 hypothetical protein G8759_25300 [Spirosoma aureum]